MTLAPGSRLGGYEIVALLGAGGMGEVYRARDGRLTRDVAVKVLPAIFAQDPERLARFAREANLLAALNHPNVAAIYGFEASDSTPALILELVDGPTLAERLLHGPLPIDDALSIGRQVADALEAAHAQGIVHRDLKPANIKVRPDGTVKVLDFGLAKAVAVEASPAVVAAAPTITSPAATAAGTLMGTAAYMSPEQARGKAIDKRSDIWAFGAVLYEMLTGRRAFDGDDIPEALANVLKTEPDWAALPAATPAPLVRALRRCMAKDPKVRIHDIADVRLELVDAEQSADGGVAPRGGDRRTTMSKWERTIWAALAIGLAGIAAVLFVRKPPPAPAPAVLRYQVQPPPGQTLGAVSGIPSGPGSQAAALSRDGTRIVFVATDRDGVASLWIQPLDSLTARRLPDSAGGYMPFWSPDGSAVAFFAGRRLYRVDLARNERREICALTAGSARGGAWSSDDQIVFFTATGRAFRVPADGGTATELALGRVEGQVGLPGWPAFLPDGRHFLYWARSGQAGTGIYSASVAGDAPRFVVASDSQAAVVASGHLLFGRNVQLYQQAFDPVTMTVSGSAAPIVDQLSTVSPVGWADFSAADNGRLAYRSALESRNQLAWVGRDGKVLRTLGGPGNYRGPAMSHDERRLVYTDSTDGNLKILDVQRGIAVAFTSEPGFENSPIWSLDDSTIYYRRDDAGLFAKDASGTTAPTQLLARITNGPTQVVTHPALGPSILFFGIVGASPSQDVLLLPLAGKREPIVLIATAGPDVEPQISPDGKWLAFASENDGRYEVYVEPFPSDGRRWTVSTAGGRQPYWRSDGRELFFVGDDRRFYSIAVPERPTTFEIQPTFLFDMNAAVHNTRNSYIPGRDGKSFLVNTLLDNTGPSITVVSDWRAR